jgi:hypothetical protein
MDNFQKNIAKLMIKHDASFIIGLLLSLRQFNDKNDIPFLFSSIDFFSLIIYEASQFYSHNDPALKAKLQSDFSETVKQSRQRMKLFDDKVLGIEGIGELFINTLTPEHQRKLSEDHPFPLPKWMWTDIGIYLDVSRQIPVGSTHLASFNSGITNPKDFFSNQVSHGLGQHLGSFLKLFADTITFVRIRDISIATKDMRYKQIYSRKNYGSKDEKINAGLSVIDIRLNFLALLASKIVQWPTLFKWKFLSIYHSISSLDGFSKSEHFNTLDIRQKEAITRVLESPVGKLMLDDRVIPLRNTLTHYGIDTRIDSSKITEDAKDLFGLVNACLPDWSYKELHDFLDEQLSAHLLDMFNIWTEESNKS